MCFFSLFGMACSCRSEYRHERSPFLLDLRQKTRSNSRHMDRIKHRGSLSLQECYSVARVKAGTTLASCLVVICVVCMYVCGRAQCSKLWHLLILERCQPKMHPRALSRCRPPRQRLPSLVLVPAGSSTCSPPSTDASTWPLSSFVDMAISPPEIVCGSLILFVAFLPFPVSIVSSSSC